MIAPGDSVGPYQVTALLGRGGMGEVFKAHDPRLGRHVAVKVSYEAFTDRFTREARAIAALNHTNICHLYDVGPDYLVMELVEGESPQGPMSFEEALPIITQLIDGIEAAHERGIVHRDLKPANIRITPDGVVKILDFGLAKALAPGSTDATPNPMDSPTTVAPAATAAATILGTAAYMAPEQARGKPADRRADIWAFGVIIYELLTGRRLFTGDTSVEILGQVLNKTPDLSAAPARARPLLAWCLEPDRRDRLQAIGDARRLLRDALAGFTGGRGPASGAGTWVSRAGWVVAAIAVVALAGAALAGVAWLPGRDSRVDQPFMHLSLPMPGNAPPSFLALSPNGRMIVMLEAGSSLVVRSLDSNVVRPLPRTALGRTPFWSPDSRTIAFFADNALKTIPASGGPSRVLCTETGLGNGGTWSRDGIILFATQAGSLKRVPADGGECVDVIRAEAGVRTSFPTFLPDGVHFVYGRRENATGGVYVATLDDLPGRRLLPDYSSLEFVPDSPTSSAGHLLLRRDGNLMAQSFDATTLQLSGEPFVVAEQVGYTSHPPQMAASASAVGTIAVLRNGNPVRQLIWYDRDGRESGRSALTGSRGGAASLAPDGRAVAFVRGDDQGSAETRVLDLERNQESRLLSRADVVVWSPDSRRVAVGFVRDKTSGLATIPAGGGELDVLFRGDNRMVPTDWSRDGRYITYTEIDPKTLGDIRLLPLSSPPGPPVVLVRTPANESQGAVSPDGRWLAYTSVQSPPSGVYLRRLSSDLRVSDAVVTVSIANALEPRWRADGKELFYLERIPSSRRSRVMAVPVGETSDNPLGVPRPLFEFSVLPAFNVFSYAPSADGQRFVVNAYATEDPASLEVLINWPASLRK
jgi:Tol biopolymer transport system component/predicted Ser/Thr protein kinase